MSFESELNSWSDAALAAMWAEVEAYLKTATLSDTSQIRALAHRWYAEHGSIGALQFQRCCDAVALVIARRAVVAGFGATAPSLVFLDVDSEAFDESAWATVIPQPGEVWIADTLAPVTILALASTDEWACGPYAGHGVEPEWTRSFTRGQLLYRASALASAPADVPAVDAAGMCQSCTHWTADPDLTVLVDTDDDDYEWVPLFPAGGGRCAMARSESGRPVAVSTTAIARDADTYAASLVTSAVHRCGMWAARSAG